MIISWLISKSKFYCLTTCLCRGSHPSKYHYPELDLQEQLDLVKFLKAFTSSLKDLFTSVLTHLLWLLLIVTDLQLYIDLFVWIAQDGNVSSHFSTSSLHRHHLHNHLVTCNSCSCNRCSCQA